MENLERSCEAGVADGIRMAPSCRGFERVEAFFSGHAFDPHRHDTYAIGCTVQGVQSFRYRGASEHCLPGQVFVLHPDETHDGHAGTSAGLRYRILYAEPRIVRDALGGAYRPLPFVRRPVSTDAKLAAAILPTFEGFDRPLEELHQDQLILGLADALAAADPSIARRTVSARHWTGVERARELLDANIRRGVTSSELEAATGLTRYAAARHFRACLGTSPYRYLLLRRLDRARSAIRRGMPLVEAALSSGFADQSHMSRHFKKAYGVSPGRWAVLAGGTSSE